MSSRTGQRGTSVATSQRKHRSRSTTRYDLEKKPKKKDLRTTGTTSLVSIPNSIKLNLLNSGLISFEDNTTNSLNESQLHELEDDIEVEAIKKDIGGMPAEDAGLTIDKSYSKTCTDVVNALVEIAELTPEINEYKRCEDNVNEPAEEKSSVPAGVPAGDAGFSIDKRYSKSCTDVVNTLAENAPPAHETNEYKRCEDDVNEPAKDAGSTPEKTPIKICTNLVNTLAENALPPPETNEHKRCEDNFNEPAKDAGSTLEKTPIKTCTNLVNTLAENAPPAPETNEHKRCEDDFNEPAKDAQSTPEKTPIKICTNLVNTLAENAPPAPETNEHKRCEDDFNEPAKDAQSTPEKTPIKICTNLVNTLAENAPPAPETNEHKRCEDDFNEPAKDAGSTPEKTPRKTCTNLVNTIGENAPPAPETNEHNTCNDGVVVPTEDIRLTPGTSNVASCSSHFNVYDKENATDSCQEDSAQHKRHATSKFKKSCIDFMLEEDIGDFSDGRSDLWSQKDLDSSSLTDEEKKSIKKKLKRKRQKEKKDTLKEQAPLSIKKQKRVNQVKQRKEVKERGLSYETSSGKIKQSKRIKENPCKEGKCPRNCFEILEERRQSLFDYFWGLDDQQKKEFIVNCAKPQMIKRKKTDASISRRSKSYEYYINEGKGRRQVCQKFLLDTLDITQAYLLYNAMNRQEGISLKDQRTRHAINKYDEATKQIAKEYIESLPVLPSHYNRKKSTKLYLPQEFKNVSNLYRLYKEHCQKDQLSFLSERLFMDLFNTEYNIAFHIPKKDKCKFCTKYENTVEKTVEDLQEYENHKAKKEATYKRCEIHRNLVNKTILTSSFDLQKVLNTPHGNGMMLYYSRKYTVYNLTVYESGTQNGYCYTWGEADGKRGSAEIGTCLYKYLKDVDKRELKYLILYCDSCGGQSKNKVILSVLIHFLEKSKNLEAIQINYLLPGHTYMPVDSMHSVIEREVRKLTVWSPTQWPTFMQTARKTPHPYEVNVLDHTDFIDWQVKANKIFTTETTKNKNLRLKELRVVTFKKQNLNKMEVKYTMMEEGETYTIPLKLNTGAQKGRQGKTKGKGVGKGMSNRAIIENRPFDENITKLYASRLPISLPKYKDLKKLCDDGTIPKMYHKDYLTLPYDTQVIDTVSEDEENVEDVLTENSVFENEPGEKNKEDISHLENINVWIEKEDENTLEDEIPFFENINIQKRKRKLTSKIKENEETVSQKRKKVIPKKQNKDYLIVDQTEKKNIKELTGNTKATPKNLRKVIPKLPNKEDKTAKQVKIRQGNRGRGK